MSGIEVVRSSSREGWTQEEDPSREVPATWQELEVFASGEGKFTTGLWERGPDTWSFDRQYDEVAVILQGAADIETEDGRVLSVGPGDVFVTPKGTKGVWHVKEKVVKFFAIYDA